jgi:PAS domain S-box-containing protein
MSLSIRTAPQTLVTDPRGNNGSHANSAYSETLKHELEQARVSARMFEERLDLLLQTSGDGLWDWNLRTDELYLSERWSQILGHKHGSVTGHVSSLWLSFIHQDDSDGVIRAIYSHLRGETARFESEYRVVASSNDIRWVHSRGIANRDERGQPSRMVGSHRDIGERKRAEDRIRESQEIIRRNEERFRAMIENGSDLITLVDGNGVITYQSPSITRVLGFSAEELIGVSVIELIHADDRALLYDKAAAAVASGDHTFTVEVRARDKFGRQRWLEVIGSTRPRTSVGSLVILNSSDIARNRSCCWKRKLPNARVSCRRC